MTPEEAALQLHAATVKLLESMGLEVLGEQASQADPWLIPPLVVGQLNSDALLYSHLTQFHRCLMDDMGWPLGPANARMWQLHAARHATTPDLTRGDVRHAHQS